MSSARWDLRGGPPESARAKGGPYRDRQLLKQGGMSASDLPGRAGKPRGRRFPLGAELAPVIEAMWREGMRYQEIAEVFESSCEAVHRLIWARVAQSERSAQAAARQRDSRSQDERLHDGMRAAQAVLADKSVTDPCERSHVSAVVNGWLAAHSQSSGTVPASSPEPPEAAATSAPPLLSPQDLHGQLGPFKDDLRAGGLRESTIHAYLMGARFFVRWLAGDYVPGPRRGERVA